MRENDNLREDNEKLQGSDAVFDNETTLNMIQQTAANDYEEIVAQEDQNLPMAIAGGFIASFACIIIWTLITVITKYQIGYMAIGVGFAIGFAIQKFGKSSGMLLGILGAALALFTCFFGNFFSYIYLISQEYSVGFFEVLSDMDLESCILLTKETFQPMDAVFYLIAIYTGFKYSSN